MIWPVMATVPPFVPPKVVMAVRLSGMLTFTALELF